LRQRTELYFKLNSLKLSLLMNSCLYNIIQLKSLAKRSLDDR